MTASLGPSNDDTSDVQEEIEAAEYAMRASLSPDVRRGWDAHFMDSDPPFLGGISWRAGWLAREIATHDDRDQRDADAWSWDISRPLAEQFAETAADDAATDATVTGTSEPGTTDRANTEDEIDAMADDGRLTGIAMRMAIAAGVDWTSLDGEEQDGWHEQAIQRLRDGSDGAP